MELPRWLSSTVLLLAWSGIARAGWYLDYSCHEYAKDLERSMSSAFDLASAGSLALKQVVIPLADTATNAEKQSHQAQVDLVSYIFQEMMKGEEVNKDAPEYINANDVLAQVQVFKEYKGLSISTEIEMTDRAIAAREKKNYTPPKLPPGVTEISSSELMKKENIVVYCDLSRFGETDKNCDGSPRIKSPKEKSTLFRCNKSTRSMTVYTATQKKCESQNPNAEARINVSLALEGVSSPLLNKQMFTISSGGPKYDSKDPSKLNTVRPPYILSSEIQICPTYYEVFKQRKIKTFADQGMQPAAARSSKNIFKVIDKAFDKAVDKLWPDDASDGGAPIPMNLYWTSDAVFLHEMTHAIWGAGTKDVDAPNSYAWKNIRDISKKMSPNNLEKATNNADSYSFFCLGSKMINPGGGKTPQRAYDDGTIKALEKAKVKREALKTMQALRRDEPISSKHTPSSQHVTSSKGLASTKHATASARKDVLYRTVEKILTTVVTKKVKRPYTTIDSAHFESSHSKPSDSKPSHSKLSHSKPSHSKSSHPRLSNNRPTSSSSGSHSKSSSLRRPSSAHREVLYTTVKEVFTTVVTKQLKKPWTTIDDTHTHPPPAPPKPDHSKSSSGRLSTPTSSSSHVRSPRSKLTSAKSDNSKSTSHSSASKTHHPVPPPPPPHGSRSSQKSDHSKPTGSGSSRSSRSLPPVPTTSSPTVQHTTVIVTSDHSTSSVVFIGVPLPNPKGKSKPAWKCTGPICDPKCSFPMLCKKTRGGWGLKTGWKPRPSSPGGPPPPPGGPSPPPTDEDPPKSEPKQSEPDRSEPKESHKTTSKDKTSSHRTTLSASSSSCKPRITSICSIVVSVLKGSNAEETTKRATQRCKTTTLHECSMTIHGATSTTTVDNPAPAVTPIEFVDAFDTSVPDWQSLQDVALAALIADTTDPYEYVDQASAPPTSTNKPASSGQSTVTKTSKKASSATHKPNTMSINRPTTVQKSSSSSKPIAPGFTPKCGQIESKLSQHAFDSGDNLIFKDFCKNWSATKESDKTVEVGGNVVTLQFNPNTGGKKCTMECKDAYHSLAHACAQGSNGNGSYCLTVYKVYSNIL